ncbi:hypothetical protein NCC49_005188 [Naganishia albida]|nr:hypothetical protein NCC49_005188 [Naganishia albida]
MNPDPTSLRAALSVLFDWNGFAARHTVEEHEERCERWLDTFAPLLNDHGHDLQIKADMPPILWMYVWEGIHNVLPGSFSLTKEQTKFFDKVFEHDFATEEDQVDPVWPEFLGAFDVFKLTYSRLHLEIAPRVEAALLGRFTAEILKKCDHQLAVAHRTSMHAVADGCLDELRNILEGSRDFDSAEAAYGKWKASFLCVMGGKQEGGVETQAPHASPASIAKSTFTEETQADARSSTYGNTVDSHSIPFEGAQMEAFVNELIEDASTIVSTERGRLVSSRYRSGALRSNN